MTVQARPALRNRQAVLHCAKTPAAVPYRSFTSYRATIPASMWSLMWQ